MERDAKFGGDVEYTSFQKLVKDFEAGLLHPLDLKIAVAKYLNMLLEDARKRLGVSV